MILLDTNVIIDLLNNEDDSRWNFLSQEDCVICGIVISELYSGIRGKKEAKAIENINIGQEKQITLLTKLSKKINEKTGISFAVEELKTLKRFKPGMEWRKAGGTLSVYNDHDDFDYTDPETGRTVHITKNVAIVPTTYKMTYAKDYRLLLDEIQLYGDYKRSRE